MENPQENENEAQSETPINLKGGLFNLIKEDPAKEYKALNPSVRVLLSIPLLIFSLFATLVSIYIFFDSINKKELTFLLLLGLVFLITVGAAGLSAATRLFSGKPRKRGGGLFSIFFLRFFGVLFMLAPLLFLIFEGTIWFYSDYSIAMGVGSISLASLRKKSLKKKEKHQQ
jgi:MFS family permease